MALQRRRVLFIDSALPEEIEKALSIGFQGVTTNPSLTAQAPKGDTSKDPFERYISHMNKIAEICNEHPLRDGSVPSLSVEVFSLEPYKMLDQAKDLLKGIKYDNLAIKIPISYKETDYLDVIKKLAEDGIKINATCGFSASQLELAAQAGARFVSLFYNRAIDYFNKLPNSDGRGQELALYELRKARKFLDENQGLESEIILGSIRKPYDVVNGWENGADIVTAGYKVIPGMIRHPATDESVEGFDNDLKKWLQN